MARWQSRISTCTTGRRGVAGTPIVKKMVGAAVGVPLIFRDSASG
jgi:hypothetical protein